MKKTFRLLLSSLFTALLFFCGCTEHRLHSDPAASGPVIIGALLPLSGKDKLAGDRMTSGLQQAEYELNTQRGINNRQVKVMFLDSKSSFSGAQEAFSAAVAAGAAGIICGGSDREVQAILPLAPKHSIPTLICRSTADSAAGANPFVFRCIHTNRQQGEALAGYLWYWRQMLKISVLMDSSPDAEYERSTARSTAEYFRELGGTVTNTPVYSAGNFSKAVNEALITGPQAIIVSARGKRAAEIVRDIRQKGYKGAVCGLDGWDDPDFFKTLSSIGDPGDCVFVSYYSDSAKSEEFKDFSKNFRQRQFHIPGNLETISYDALKLMAIGLGRAQNIDAFRENWMTIRNHFGASATYTMLKNGSVDRTMFIHAISPARHDGFACQGRLLRSFMHSKLASYRY